MMNYALEYLISDGYKKEFGHSIAQRIYNLRY